MPCILRAGLQLECCMASLPRTIALRASSTLRWPPGPASKSTVGGSKGYFGEALRVRVMKRPARGEGMPAQGAVGGSSGGKYTRTLQGEPGSLSSARVRDSLPASNSGELKKRSRSLPSRLTPGGTLGGCCGCCGCCGCRGCCCCCCGCCCCCCCCCGGGGCMARRFISAAGGGAALSAEL